MSDGLELVGRRALVTGGAKGVGEAVEGFVIGPMRLRQAYPSFLTIHSI